MMNKTLLTAVFAFSALLILPSASAPKVAVKDLTTELRKDPEGIDCVTPRLSWKVVSEENKTLQTAYRIRVRLVDLRTGDLVVEKVEEGFAGFPWFFELEYDAKDLRKGDPHGLVAEVLAGDAVLYRTDTQYRLPEAGSVAGADLVVTRSP